MFLRLRAARSRAMLLAVLALSSVFGIAAPVSAAASTTEAERVISIARAQVGDRYSWAATGPNQFDCSGLIWFSFREAGLADRIGGKRKTVSSLYRYFNSQGKADKVNPRPGDLVVWGNNKHIGIYIGDGQAVSALVNPYGVKVHPVKGYLNTPFKAYLHVNLGR